MAIANDVLKKAVGFIISSIDEKSKLIMSDLVEPLELFLNHHDQTAQHQFEQAR